MTFRVLGFPVTIHTSFLVIVALLGYSSENGVAGMVVWLGVVTVSVIVHELGHALVARPVGGDPRIDLYGMAGLTRWDARRAGRGRQIAVSVAGPGAGVAFGLLILLAWTAVDPPRGTVAHLAFASAVFVNIAWGVLNLLPMLPLDGGHVVRALLPGDETARARRSAWVSLVVAAAVAVGAMSYGAPIAAALVVFFAAGNIQTLMALRRNDSSAPADAWAAALSAAERAVAAGRPDEALALLPVPEATPARHAVATAYVRAMALLRAGRAREAQDTMLALPQGGAVDPTFAATLLLANGQDRLAYEQLAYALPTATQWPVRELTALLVARGADVDAVLAPVGPLGAMGAQAALLQAGRPADAARYGERALAAYPTEPLVAYEVARAWAFAGELSRALAALDAAARNRFGQPQRMDADPAFAALRDDAGYAAVRAHVVANASGLGQPSAPG